MHTVLEPTFTLGGDLTVHRLGFGAMRLTEWDGSSYGGRSAALAVARLAVELGVDFFDTADSYDLGANEELLADALHPYPAGVVIATKAGRTRPDRETWGILGDPDYLRQQCELSLRRLRTERIDLFQLHRIDPRFPLDEQVGALRRLRDDGKIRHVGLSEVTVDQIDAARRIVDIASVQNRFHLADRHSTDVLTYCEREGIAFIPYLPFAGGAHARVDGPLGAVATELDATPAQVALAWLLHLSPVMMPIPGTRTAAHLRENAAAASIQLDADQLARLEAAAA